MGQKVEYQEQCIEQFEKVYGTTRRGSFKYLRNGLYTRCSPDFYNLTGRKPTSYKEYLTLDAFQQVLLCIINKTPSAPMMDDIC